MIILFCVSVNQKRISLFKFTRENGVPPTITGPTDGAIDLIYSFGSIFEHAVVLGKLLNLMKKITVALLPLLN